MGTSKGSSSGKLVQQLTCEELAWESVPTVSTNLVEKDRTEDQLVRDYSRNKSIRTWKYMKHKG